MLIWPIALLTYISPYYINAFERYNVYAAFGGKYPNEQINTEFQSVLTFVQPGSSSSLDPKYYSYEDLAHMQDVQRIFQNVYLIGFVALIISLVTFTFMHRMEFGILTALNKTGKYFQEGILAVVVVILLFLAFWQYTFVGIHQLLFPGNNYWQLDPRTSNLIKYLPAQIFQELLLIYIIVVMIEFLVIRYIGRRQIKKHKTKIKNI
jgi:integral membrane protein (TIGR01906 family)